MRKVIVNTTPLVALADIGQLELLHELYEEILIPEAVWEEVESEPAKTMVSDARRWCLSPTWSNQCQPK